MASTTLHALCATLALLLFASQTANADLYRFLPPAIPSPRPFHSTPPTPKSSFRTPLPRPPTSTMAQQFMAPQNAARLSLGLSPLVWDSRLQSYAEWWANQRRSDCALIHSPGPYGENLFWGSGTGWTPTQAAETWTVEGKFYDYFSNTCAGGMCGHYTQIVWRDTKRIGCASIICDNGLGQFMTCNYDPAGNYVGEKPY